MAHLSAAGELVDITISDPPLEEVIAKIYPPTSLNLRQGPGTSFAVVGSLKKSEMVDGLAVSPDGGWAQVRKSSGVIGWASLKYMTKIARRPPPARTTSS
jgi:uncharacterized protein YgiM (DUF1202 family)